MAQYEYKCKECSEIFQVEHGISEEPKQECPKCKKPALVRLISLSSFSLKGKGWFKTGGY